MEPRETLEARRPADVGLTAAPGASIHYVMPAGPEERAAIEPLAEPVTLVQEGWNVAAIAGVVAGLASTAAAVYVLTEVVAPGAAVRTLLVAGAGFAAAGWLLRGRLRRLLRSRREFTVGPQGLALWQSDPPLPEDEFRLIPWSEMVMCWASTGRSRAFLGVTSADHGHIALDEKPPRPETLEFLHRFRQEAMRHPRAEPRPRETGGSPLLNVRRLAYAGAAVALIAASFVVQPMVDVPPQLYGAGAIIGVALFHGARIWLQLDDSDIAHADRTRRSWKARMRNRLRALLGIRHV